MNNTTKKLIPLSRDSIQLIKGLIVGKVLTILVMGGLWLLVRQYLEAPNASIVNRGIETASETEASTFKMVSNVPIGSFKYGGSTAWAPIRQLVHSLIQIDRPELKLRYATQASNPSSATGIEMLLDGKIDFAQLSRPLTKSEYEAAAQKGFTLKQRQVATDGVAVAVNPTLSVSGLTVEQLRQIYLGKITNWKQLGGSDLPITPFSDNSQEVKLRLFTEEELGKQNLGSNVQYVNTPTEALRQVRQNKGGVYLGSARAIVPQCTVKPLALGISKDNLVNPFRGQLVPSNECPQTRNYVNTNAIANGSYPLQSKLFVVTKQNNGREEQIGNAYTRLLLTSEGQKAIAEAGFVPLR